MNLSYSKNLQTSLSEWEKLSLSSDVLLKTKTIEQLNDMFLKSLDFGTAGLRGMMEPGFNRMNSYTIKKASLAVFNYFSRKKTSPLKVIISFDTRNNSLSFAESTAALFILTGCDVILFKDPTPTPLLSYAIRYYKADVGIMITASHNPKEYNGYKVFSSTGGQILTSDSKEILEEMKVIQEIPNTTNLELSMLTYPKDDFYQSYYSKIDNLTQLDNLTEKITVVYTPLYGTGKIPIQHLLSQKKEIYFILVKEQSDFDGNFPTCPSPNPEKKEVYEIAEKYALSTNADIIISTDPDADRVGICVKNNQTKNYTLLSGNEIGIIMSYYILSNRKDLSQKSYICSSVVSTDAVKSICALFGINHKQTLTGFKYIAETIDKNPSEEFLFGFEESYGYLIGDYIRDKDAVSATALLVKITEFCKRNSQTLLDYLEDIYKRIGTFQSKTIQIEIPDLFDSMNKITSFLQESTGSLLNYNIIEKYDYKNQEIIKNHHKIESPYFQNLDKTDLTIFYLEPHYKLAIRPSGTEPVIKVYLEVLQGKKDLRFDLENFENKVRNNLIDLVK